MNKVLWRPSEDRANGSTMAEFMRWLEANRGLTFTDYNAMWRWSIEDLEGFWSAIWEFFDLRASTPWEQVITKRQMPGAVWGPGMRLNYTDQILKHVEGREDIAALVLQSETFGRRETTWRALRAQVASVAHHLRHMGVGEGDRIDRISRHCEHRGGLVALCARHGPCGDPRPVYPD